MRSLKSGNTRIDGDGDGIPCEALCKGGKGGSPPPRGSSSPRPKATMISGRAGLISVGDGDTIRVRASSGESVTIRLACIDAPELAQGASGAAATQTVDRYGRTVAEVYANGRNLNVEMVRRGKAYVYWQYLSGCDANDAYLKAESEAQRSRQGVWRSGNEVKPWDFRRNR